MSKASAVAQKRSRRFLPLARTIVPKAHPSLTAHSNFRLTKSTGQLMQSYLISQYTRQLQTPSEISSTFSLKDKQSKLLMGSARQTEKSIPTRSSASSQFPGKLHDLMTYTEQKGMSDIISWVQNGQAIMVHDADRLLQILPHFGFSQTKYRSFQRQL